MPALFCEVKMSKKICLALCVLLGLSALAGVRVVPLNRQGDIMQFAVLSENNHPLYTATLKTEGLRVLGVRELSGDVNVWRISDDSIAVTGGNGGGTFEALICEEEGQISTTNGDVLYSYGYSADESEVRLLARVITAEAGGETYDGMLAVGTVVMNRVDSPDYPDTVKGVLTQKNQFADPSSKPSNEALKAAREILSGKRIFPEGVLMFQRKKTDSWRGYEWYCTIGDHNFYCEVEK